MKDARQEQLKREALTDHRRARIAWGVIWGMLLAACATFALATRGSYTDFCASRPLALDRLPYALTTYDVGQVRDEGAWFSFDFLDAGALVEVAPIIVEATCTGQRTHRYNALLTDVTIDRVYRGEGLPGIAVGERISVYEPIAIDNIAKRSSPFSALSKLLSEGDTEVRTSQVRVDWDTDFQTLANRYQVCARGRYSSFGGTPMHQNGRYILFLQPVTTPDGDLAQPRYALMEHPHAKLAVGSNEDDVPIASLDFLLDTPFTTFEEASYHTAYVADGASRAEWLRMRDDLLERVRARALPADAAEEVGSALADASCLYL